MSDPRFERPSWRGRTNVDALTIAALEHAEDLCDRTFVVTQGSYQGDGGDPDSAGTHARGGVVDLRWSTVGDAGILALRKAGFAAWHRTPAQGPWPHHVHAVLVDHPLLAPSAARQVASYRRGRNGLANNGPDDGPRLDPIPVYQWKDWFAMASKEELSAVVREVVRDEMQRQFDLNADLSPNNDNERDTMRNALRGMIRWLRREGIEV